MTGQAHQPQDYINPQGGGQRFGYDGKGNVTGITATMQGPNGRNDRTLDQTIKATLTRDQTTGQVTSASDGRDSGTFDTTWTYSYTNGNLTKVKPPTTTPTEASGGIKQLGETNLTYDGLSRVKTITDGEGQVRTFTYDHLDRVTNVELKNSSGTVLATESSVYDDDGNMTIRTDWDSPTTSKTTTTEYDALGRMKKETLPGSKTNEYTYDPSSNLATLKTNGTDTVTYQYDDVNLVSKMLEPPDTSGGVAPETVFGYDDRNNRTSTLYPNGVQVSQKFLGDDAVQQIEAKKGTTVIRKYDYTYTKGAQQTDLRQTVTDKDGKTTTYDYDHLDRLKEADTRTGANALVDEFLYTYDAASNIKQKTKQVGTGTPTVTSYAYNQANQLCWTHNAASSAACGSAPSGATAFTYDANGNTLTGNRPYEYNIKDQTTKIAGTSLAYLGLNQNEITDIGSHQFQNNGLGVGFADIGDDMLFRRDPNGQILGRKKLTDGARHYYVSDALGSTVAFTDSAGAVANSYDYEPYGSVKSSTGTLFNPFKFTGGHDTGQGVYHYGARQYDPGLGRWTQQDPLDQSDDLRQANRYMYVGGDPVNRSDPNGMCYACGQGGNFAEGYKRGRQQASSAAKDAAIRHSTYCVLGAGGGAVASSAEKGLERFVRPTSLRPSLYAFGAGCGFGLYRGYTGSTFP